VTTTGGQVGQRAALHIRLFVSGRDAPRSSRAIAAVEDALATLEPGAAREIVDVIETPDAAEEARVMVTPLLLRVSPGPQLRVIGDLSAASREELLQWIHEGVEADR
jgi:circadian clock protein KaiB